jgi:hypothetical protein
MNKGSMAVKIHNVERIETAIVFDVSGTKEIGLMDVVEVQGCFEIRVLYSLGGIRSFF